MTLTGDFLAKTIPNIDKHLHLVVAAVIFLSLLPGIIAWLRARMKPPAPPAPAVPIAD
jgi:membrane-associated protein